MRFLRLSLILWMVAQPAWATVDTELNDEMATLLHTALQRSTDSKLRQSLGKYGRGSEKGKSGAKDIGLNYLGLPRGLEASIEGAHLVLDDEQPIKNLEAAECALQLQNDRLHEQLCSQILQMASSIGARGTRLQPLTSLEQLVGNDQAARLAEAIFTWTQSVKRKDAFQQPKWDFATLRAKVDTVAAMAERNDFTMIALRNKVHHFGDHTRAKRRTTKVVEGAVTALTIFGPGFGTSIAANGVGAMWGVSNGGSEESKLLKELYYQKQLDSRATALRNEAELALTAHQEALREKNLPLLVCSEAMLAQLVGAIGIPHVLEKPILNHGAFAQQSIATGDF